MAQPLVHAERERHSGVPPTDPSVVGIGLLVEVRQWFGAAGRRELRCAVDDGVLSPAFAEARQEREADEEEDRMVAGTGAERIGRGHMEWEQPGLYKHVEGAAEHRSDDRAETPRQCGDDAAAIVVHVESGTAGDS